MNVAYGTIQVPHEREEERGEEARCGSYWPMGSLVNVSGRRSGVTAEAARDFNFALRTCIIRELAASLAKLCSTAQQIRIYSFIFILTVKSPLTSRSSEDFRLGNRRNLSSRTDKALNKN